MRSLLLLFVLLASTVHAQSTYFIKDAVSEDAIPFVKVYPDNRAPFISDLDGAFQLHANTQSFVLKYQGYRDTLISVAGLLDSIIYIQPNVQMVEEIIVLPGENPAHRIMKKAIDNRRQNHPLKNDAFRYESYSKFTMDIEPEALASIPENTTDSMLIDMRAFFNQQHLFILESTTRRTFSPPRRDQEEVLAYKISGFTDPRFSVLANTLQSFSFYDNEFNFLGVPYINPLAYGGINRYLFVLEDSTLQETDTTYTIYFRPRSGKNFNGMEGRLYINTNGYAIEKVTASPYKDTTGSLITIVQEYTFVDNKKWFPSKLSASISQIQPAPSVPELVLIGKAQTYIKNIVIHPDDLPKRSNNIALYTAEDAGEQSESEWNAQREYRLTEKEIRTYETIDSIAKAEKLNERLKLLSVISEMKVPLGYVNADLTRLVSYNYYERYRLGLGLETSQKLMKNIVVGGYFAYGTGDKAWKYGGYSTFHLDRKQGMKIDLKYQQDVLERGGLRYSNRTLDFSNTDAYRFLFISSMERQRLGEVAFTTDIRANMTVRFFGNYQRVAFTDDYQFLDPQNQGAAVSVVDVAETGIELKWSIREKYMLLGNLKVPQSLTKFPTLKLKAVRGWKGWFESELDYYRLNASISQRFRFIGIGEIRLRAEAGQTIGDVPLFLAQLGNGTGKNWLTSVENSFETMAPATFYHTQFAAFYTRFAFKSFKTKAKWNEPKISLNHALGYGNFARKDLHSISFQSMEKGYYEAGVILDGMYVSSFMGLGIGVFYNYGAYANPDWKQNIMPKIAISFIAG